MSPSASIKLHGQQRTQVKCAPWSPYPPPSEHDRRRQLHQGASHFVARQGPWAPGFPVIDTLWGSKTGIGG
jgi:hypothetical protein